MRIAYVSLHWPRTRNSGVGKKIQSQVVAWNAMGHSARLFMHTSRYAPSELIEAETFFFETGGRLQTEWDRVRAMRNMLNSLRAFEPDIIYFRYSIYVYPAHQLMNIAPVVEEINTNDLTQHEGLGRVYSIYNRMTRGVILRGIHGLVSVSHELAHSPAFAVFNKPVRVIANGVDLSNFLPLPAPSNDRPKLVFIGNPGYSWHGVDKLVDLARLAPDIDIDIVGYQDIPGSDNLPSNISLHGYLDLEKYRLVLANADAAVSSLALHRVCLEEASPLKSRECLAFGLPLIVAYNDTDLGDVENECLLRIPNKEDNIHTHAQSIRDFAWRMRGRRVEHAQIASLDLKAKEVERLEFFKKILGLSEKLG